MSRRDQNQWLRPTHGYDPRNAAAAAAQWYGGASMPFPDPGAAALHGMNPFGFAPNPFFNNLLFQNPAALAAYQLQQQQAQAHHFASHAYHQAPAGNANHRPTKPAAADKPAPPGTQSQQQPPPGNQQAVLHRAQEAARKAREELVKGGEGVTAWKVAQAVLVALKADSWDSLGVQAHDVPLLRDLFLIEGKVNAFIHCYVAARKIVTVYDLEVEICKNEGVLQFEELGLGPFLQHPLVAHYFLVPADLSVVPKLSSEEIVNVLLKFVDNSKKRITIVDFLNHLAEKKSVSAKEKLGVRVQSLGLHISLLQQAKQTEVSAAKLLGNTSGSGNSSQEKDLLKNASFHTHKKALDKRFITLTNRIKQLPGINKHIHFDSTDDETNGDTDSEDGKSDDNENKNECSVLDKKDGDKRLNSCPYPSKTEELERLGLKSEINKRPSLENSKPKESGKKGKVTEKRKFEEIGSPSCSGKQPKKQQKMQKHEASPNCFLSIGKLENFVTTWKETCREHPVQQVLEMLANYYGRTLTEKKRIINFCSQYPGIGLLNVAVKSMGCGLLDSIYDVIQLASENNVSSSPLPNTTTEVMEIEPPSKENTGCTDGAHKKSEDNRAGHSVAIDDVIRRVTEYIESNSKISGDVTLQVRALNDCETWVTTHFSADQFSALGHGTFLEFLDKHCHQFRTALSSFLKEGTCNSSSPEVSVLQQQTEFLLCQAESNWLEDGVFSEDSFVMLLKKQFPTISFNIVQDKSGEGVPGFIEGQKNDIQTNSLKFSISLLEKRWSGTLPSRHDNVDELGNSVAEQSYYCGTVCSRDAINCLLRAPMLSDLHHWSHWDSLFAPTLGSFVHWLLNTGPIQDLACIATTDGRFIRVDSSATVDQFLEAIIQGSPFQVAVKLLSLLYIYNGSTNTPMALLKCYAQRAIKLIVDKNNDLVNAKSENKIFMPDEPQNLSSESSACFAGQCQENFQVSSARLIRSDSLPNFDNTVHLIAKFVLDCLGHVPPEFRSQFDIYSHSTHWSSPVLEAMMRGK